MIFYRSHARIIILMIESSEKNGIISIGGVNSTNILKIEHIIYLCIKPDMRDFEKNRCLTLLNCSGGVKSKFVCKIL